MRPLISYICLLAICSLPFAVIGQIAFSGEQNEVNKTMMAIGKAWSENNLDTLEKYIAANYKHTDVRGQLQDRKTWLSYVADRKAKNVKNPDLEFEDTQIRIEGDFAFATGINIFTGNAFTLNNPNTPKAKKLRYTQVLKKEDGIWKRLIFQATYME